MSDCDLYINPSLFEGFGMTAVEAMILKVPTLLSKVSANYEVTAGLCKYYEPADDVEALAQAMVDYFKEPYTKEQLDSASIAMINRYDYRTIAAEYMDLFVMERSQDGKNVMCGQEAADRNEAL